MKLDTDLRAVADRGADTLGPSPSAEEVLAWTSETFGDRFVVAATMQDAVVTSLAASIEPGVDVLFLDTGYHFAETIGTRDAVSAVYDVNVITRVPETTVAEQDALLGPALHQRDPDRCCELRKVAPLRSALEYYDAWVTGLRRAESASRANAPLISYDEKFDLVKVNPIAAWSDDEVDDYIERNHIIVNPLIDAGYPSIGCAPCTSRPAPGADKRSGRWAGRGKVECGLHV